jgi:predicted  nucleic acid-binding Zn-ribbon protein
LNDKDDTDVEFNLKEPKIESAPYTLTGNNWQNNITSNTKLPDDNNNYSNYIKNKINNLNNLSKGIKHDYEDDNEYNNNNGKIKNDINNNHDIGKIIGRKSQKENLYSLSQGNINNLNDFNDNINNINNDLMYNNNCNEIAQLRDEKEKLIQENISLKQELTQAINTLNQYKNESFQKENDEKQVTYKLLSLQNKLEIYETSLENTKSKYEQQINECQYEITNLKNIIQLFYAFFDTIEQNILINLNISKNNALTKKEIEENLSKLKDYIFNMNSQQQKIGQNINQLYHTTDNNLMNKYEQNLKYNNDNYQSNSNYDDYLDLYNNIKEVNPNKDFKDLEQRVLMLEKELKVKQNQNLKKSEKNIFQNDIIAEKVQSKDNNSQGKKSKKKKKKKKLDNTQEDNKHEYSDIMSYKTFRVKTTKSNSSKYKIRK